MRKPLTSDIEKRLTDEANREFAAVLAQGGHLAALIQNCSEREAQNVKAAFIVGYVAGATS